MINGIREGDARWAKNPYNTDPLAGTAAANNNSNRTGTDNAIHTPHT